MRGTVTGGGKFPVGTAYSVYSVYSLSSIFPPCPTMTCVYPACHAHYVHLLMFYRTLALQQVTDDEAWLVPMSTLRLLIILLIFPCACLLAHNLLLSSARL